MRGTRLLGESPPDKRPLVFRHQLETNSVVIALVLRKNVFSAINPYRPVNRPRKHVNSLVVLVVPSDRRTANTAKCPGGTFGRFERLQFLVLPHCEFLADYSYKGTV